jgi:TolA-binding protein
MKKILHITSISFLLFALPLNAMESRELEDIIENIINSNALIKDTKPQPAKKESTAADDSKESKNNKSASFPSPDEALLKSGIQLFEASLYENSRQKFEELKSKYPDSTFKDIASIWLSKIYTEQNNYTEAIKTLTSISQESGEYPTALFYIGEINLKKGDESGAIEYLYRVPALFPDHELADDSLIAIAKLYCKNNKGNQSLEAAIKVIKNYGKRETIDDAYFIIAQVFEKDAMLKDIGIARKIYKIFLKKAGVEKAPFFHNSPLLSRVKKNLRDIETTYYNKAFVD